MYFRYLLSIFVWLHMTLIKLVYIYFDKTVIFMIHIVRDFVNLYNLLSKILNVSDY